LLLRLGCERGVDAAGLVVVDVAVVSTTSSTGGAPTGSTG